MTGYEPTVWVDNAASPRLNAEALNKIEQGIAAAGSQDSPTFTGNVTLPSTTTIGTVSSVELGYLDGVTSGIQSQLDAKAPLASPALTGTPTTPTAAAGTNTTQIASTAYVRTEVANIVNSAPATLDTLNEIAAALGSDPNFATTMTNLINTKAPSASPTFTGTVVLPSTTSIGTITSTELGYLDGVTSSIQTQLGTKAPSADPTFTGTVTLPGTTSIGNVSSTEIGYLDGVTSAIQTQISGKANSSHAHAISDVTNLQTSLDAKVDEVASTDNAIVRFNGAGGAVQNSSATLADDGSITATYFNATSNAAGTNYKVGDDAWIGDVNWANTIRITGVTEPANGYLIFGNGDSTALGRAGTGALTYGGNTIWHAGNDGSGSGLDADLLDGNHASAFALSSHTHTIANITSLQTTLDAKAPLASPSFTGTVTIQASGNPADGGGGTIRTAGSRYTLVLLPRNADATYATASEFYYDSTYVGWWAESKMGCTGDFTCNAYGYFAGNLRAMKASGDTQIEVRTVTGNPYLTRTSDTTADIYDIWKIDGTSRYYIRATTSQFLIQRYDSTPITAIGIGRTDGKVTIGTVTGAAGLELGDSGPREMVGTGSPESSVTAPAGSVWRQTDDSALTYLRWYKASGSGNTGWLPDYEGRWKDFTPTLKDSGGTTLSGWTCTGRYTVRGKWCQVIIDITASTPSAGTGEYRLYLPTDAQAATSSPVRWCAEGSLVAYDNSSGNLGWFRVSMTNAAYVTAWTPQTWPYSNGQHQLSATIPNFTWAASDKINGSFSYEIA